MDFSDYKVTKLPPSGPSKEGLYPRGTRFSGNASGTGKRTNNDANKGNQSPGSNNGKRARRLKDPKYKNVRFI